MAGLSDEEIFTLAGEKALEALEILRPWLETWAEEEKVRGVWIQCWVNVMCAMFIDLKAPTPQQVLQYYRVALHHIFFHMEFDIAKAIEEGCQD